VKTHRGRGVALPIPFSSHYDQVHRTTFARRGTDPRETRQTESPGEDRRQSQNCKVRPGTCQEGHDEQENGQKDRGNGTEIRTV
jgi:hypothetical protein